MSTLTQLPDVITVHVERGKTGKYIAELPEFDVVTEAEYKEDLDAVINDAIYTYFDIPKQYHGKIWYRPLTTTLTKVELPKEAEVHLTLTADLHRKHFH